MLFDYQFETSKNFSESWYFSSFWSLQSFHHGHVHNRGFWNLGVTVYATNAACDENNHEISYMWVSDIDACAAQCRSSDPPRLLFVFDAGNCVCYTNTQFGECVKKNGAGITSTIYDATDHNKTKPILMWTWLEVSWNNMLLHLPGIFPDLSLNCFIR